MEEDFDADESSVRKVMGWMSRNTTALGQAVANRQHTEAYIKVVEAQEKAKHKDEAAHAQEREARTSEAYHLALEAFRDASATEQKLRYTWDFCETVIDVWRTKCANERKI